MGAKKLTQPRNGTKMANYYRLLTKLSGMDKERPLVIDAGDISDLTAFRANMRKCALQYGFESISISYKDGDDVVYVYRATSVADRSDKPF